VTVSIKERKTGQGTIFSKASFKLINPSQINVSSTIKFVYYLG
jgi:hypothetical protein